LYTPDGLIWVFRGQPLHGTRGRTAGGLGTASLDASSPGKEDSPARNGFGYIVIDFQVFDEDHIDWVEHRSLTVLDVLDPKGDVSSKIWAMLRAYDLATSAAHIGYQPFECNSNTVAYDALDFVGLKPPRPPVSTPAWNNHLWVGGYFEVIDMHGKSLGPLIPDLTSVTPRVAMVPWDNPNWIPRTVVESRATSRFPYTPPLIKPTYRK